MNAAQRLGELLLRIDTLEEALRGKGIAIPGAEDPRIAELGRNLTAARDALLSEGNRHAALLTAEKARADRLQRDLDAVITGRDAAVEDLARAQMLISKLKKAPPPPAAPAEGDQTAATPLQPLMPGTWKARIFDFLRGSNYPLGSKHIARALHLNEHDVCSVLKKLTYERRLIRHGRRRTYTYEINREAAA